MYHSMFGGGANVIMLKLLVRSCWSQIAPSGAYKRPDGGGEGCEGSHRGGPSVPGGSPTKPTSPGTLGRVGPGRKLGGTGNRPP
jgi:hypothetical protein